MTQSFKMNVLGKHEAEHSKYKKQKTFESKLPEF